MNQTNSQNQTPIHFGAINGSAESIDRLANHGANVNLPDIVYDKHHTPIFYALQNSHVKCVASLITHGANLNIPDIKGLPPIFHALHSPDAINLLATNGADINYVSKDGQTQIFHAIFRGNMTAVELLISLGATVDHADNKGWTPLFYAIQRGDDRAVQLLLKHCGDVEYEFISRTSAYGLAKQIREPEMRDLIASCVENKILDIRIIDDGTVGSMLAF